MRVLVTGSRTWTDPKPIQDCLQILARAIYGTEEELVIVHGGAGRGADYIAANWAASMIRKGWNIRIERFPADWAKYRKRAGILRNIQMVNSGADLCLAFIRDGSSGASHCARIAEACGIETRTFMWPVGVAV